MVSLHHRLISLPATCLLTGAMTVAGLGGCATNRQARTAHQHCWHFGHHQAATPSPAPATNPVPAPAATDDPGQIYRVNPAPGTSGGGTRDKMPNFLPEKMPEDGNLEAPGPGASLKRKGSTLAGNQKAGGTGRNDKARGSKAGRQEAEDPADNGPVPRLHPDDKVARRDNKRARKQTARDAALQAKRGTTTNAVPTSNPVRLGKPPEIYTFTDDSEQERQPERNQYAPRESTFHPTVRSFRQPGLAAQTVSSPVQNYPVQQYPTQQYPVQQYQPQPYPAQQYYPPAGNDEFVPLPLWSDSPAGQSQPLIRSRPQDLQTLPMQTSSSPPARFTSYDSREIPRRQEVVQEPSGPLSISRLAICSEVRGFENFTEMDAGNLQSGQKFLIYASLENFKSVSTMNGYQTLTLSSLEVCTRSGKVIAKQPLGTATDVSDTIRQQYYLTHMVQVPDNLPDGDYVVTLNVYDLSSKQTTKSMIGMRITGGRGRQG